MSSTSEGYQVRDCLRYLSDPLHHPEPILPGTSRSKPSRERVSDWLAERWLALLVRVETLEAQQEKTGREVDLLEDQQRRQNVERLRCRCQQE